MLDKHKRKKIIVSWMLALSLMSSSLQVSAVAAAPAQEDVFYQQDEADTSEVQEESEVTGITEGEYTQEVFEEPSGLYTDDFPSDVAEGDITDSCDATFYIKDNGNLISLPELSQLEMAQGTEIVLPEAPETEGYRNIGWRVYQDGVLKEYQEGESYRIQGDVQFYLNRAKVYTVTYYNYDGTKEESTQECIEGEQLKLLQEDHQEEEYVYGWAVEPNAKEPTYQQGESVAVTEDMKLYRFQGKPITISFANNSGETSAAYERLTIHTYTGVDNELPAASSLGNLKFMGWSTQKDSAQVVYQAGESYKFTRSITLYCVRIRHYDLIFNNAGGTNGAAYEKFNQNVIQNSKVVMPKADDLEGYQFVGWSTKKYAQEPEYKVGETVTVKENMYLYAVRVKLCDLIFNNAGGTNGGAYAKYNQTVAKGTKVTMPKADDLEGYQFIGWSSKKNAAEAQFKAGQSVTVTDSMKLYAVRKKVVSCKVVFNNAGGTNPEAYAKYNQTVPKASKITMPKADDLEGYRFVGWSTKKYAQEPEYKAGQSVSITRNMNLYVVRKKTAVCSLVFDNAGGTNPEAYAKYNKKVNQGTAVQMPKADDMTGYQFVGWSTKKWATTPEYPVGKSIVVTKNMKLYAVRKEVYRVSYQKSDGTVYGEKVVDKGASLELGILRNPMGYTFLGWSRQKNQTSNPEYYAGQRVKFSQDTVLYPVYYSRSEEQILTKDQIKSSPHYENVIFVGDSRTKRMGYAIRNTIDSDENPQGVTFVAEGGQGLSWLKERGYNQLIEQLKKIEQSGNSHKPTAVIFNLGVNDPQNKGEYVRYMNQKAYELKKYDCDLYFMTVNPMNSKTREDLGRPAQSERSLMEFNEYLRIYLSSDYSCIDSYHYLLNTGFAFDSSGIGIDIGIDDGLHYSVATYQKIYNYCMGNLKP